MNMKTPKTIVVKFGTSVLTQGGNRLCLSHMVEIVRELARLESSGVQVVVVSSGAQAAGRETLGYPKLPKNLINRQMVATVGQNRLFNTWQNLFSI